MAVSSGMPKYKPNALPSYKGSSVPKYNPPPPLKRIPQQAIQNQAGYNQAKLKAGGALAPNQAQRIPQQAIQNQAGYNQAKTRPGGPTPSVPAYPRVPGWAEPPSPYDNGVPGAARAVPQYGGMHTRPASALHPATSPLLDEMRRQQAARDAMAPAPNPGGLRYGPDGVPFYNDNPYWQPQAGPAAPYSTGVPPYAPAYYPGVPALDQYGLLQRNARGIPQYNGPALVANPYYAGDDLAGRHSELAQPYTERNPNAFDQIAQLRAGYGVDGGLLAGWGIAGTRFANTPIYSVSDNQPAASDYQPSGGGGDLPAYDYGGYGGGGGGDYTPPPWYYGLISWRF